MPALPDTLPPPHALDAEASDPVRLGWMRGTPPPPDKRIALEKAYGFPQLRWAWSHFRELLPTHAVGRGDTAVHALPRAPRPELDGVSFTPMGAARPMSFAQSLAANYTDGIVVLHRGRIVYERYFGALDERRPHAAMSVTKSFVGTLGAGLLHEGVLDDAKPVSHYVPELAASAFGPATLRQVMDMTTGLAYSEVYTDPGAGIYDFLRAGRIVPRPPGWAGPDGLAAYLCTVAAAGTHGEAFAYKTVNTDVLAWVAARATGLPLPELLSQRIWSRLGAEQDAYVTCDHLGTAFAGGGLNTALRDLARFGEALRCEGALGGQQVVPAAAVADIRRGGDPARFAPAGFHTLPGWSYRHQWWVSHDAHGVFAARGVHGQLVWVDPKAEMVIARYASHPLAGNVNLDPASLPAWRALGRHFVQHPG